MDRPRALSIAGSDPSGGAGVQADLKTFAAFGCFGQAALTALTVQDTVGVRAVHAPPAMFVAAQIEALLEDCAPHATKVGMLFDAAAAASVAAALRGGRGGPIVVDPVLFATSGDRLLREDAVVVLKSAVLPLAALVTPNVPEAEALSGVAAGDPEEAEEAARRILAMGPAAVLVKGGHGAGARAVDVLVRRDGRVLRFDRPRLPVGRPHGAGCTLSAAIAAGLARGWHLEKAVLRAGDYVHAALAAARPIGRGAWPLDHLAARPEGTA